MRVLVTGADGFIAKNLIVHLGERESIEVLAFTKANTLGDLESSVKSADFIFHLAGVNRPKNPKEFTQGNVDLTKKLCEVVKDNDLSVPIVYASSIQAELKNPYGESKRRAEQELLNLHKVTNSKVSIFRLPNVFGKWARPNYNSAVATFCHNISRDIPININDESAEVTLVYIDDVVDSFLAMLDGAQNDTNFVEIEQAYRITVGELASQIYRFKESRDSLTTEPVGVGLTRALYSTYLSYLPKDRFSYHVPMHGDSRGVFVEMLKTCSSGQFSFFTARPGVTRGGHYHHSKTEKFLVINGEANFRFRNIVTGESHELSTSGRNSVVVETVPGWTHDITNTGDSELVVMLWANEVFDRDKPDTYACSLGD